MTDTAQRGLSIIDTDDGAISQLYRTRIAEFRRSKGWIWLNCGDFHTQSTVKALQTFLDYIQVPGRAYRVHGLIHVDVPEHLPRQVLNPSAEFKLSGRFLSEVING